MNKLKVSRKVFHIWFVLLQTFRLDRLSTKELRRQLYELYYECFVYITSEEEVLRKTEDFIKYWKWDELLKTKEYFWELAEDKQDYSDEMKWMFLYRTIQDLLKDDTKDLQKYVKLKYSEEEIEWKLNWNDELFD